MKLRQFAAGIALMVGAVAAHANVESLYSFTLAEKLDVLSTVTTGSGSSIVSFGLVGSLPVGADLEELPGTSSYALSFYDLAAGAYTLKLVTTGSDFSVAAGFTKYAIDGITPVTTGTVPLTAVPEPEAYALALAGLSVAGLLGLRRRVA